MFPYLQRELGRTAIVWHTENVYAMQSNYCRHMCTAFNTIATHHGSCGEDCIFANNHDLVGVYSDATFGEWDNGSAAKELMKAVEFSLTTYNFELIPEEELSDKGKLMLNLVNRAYESKNNLALGENVCKVWKRKFGYNNPDLIQAEEALDRAQNKFLYKLRLITFPQCLNTQAQGGAAMPLLVADNQSIPAHETAEHLQKLAAEAPPSSLPPPLPLLTPAHASASSGPHAGVSSNITTPTENNFAAMLPHPRETICVCNAKNLAMFLYGASVLERDCCTKMLASKKEKREKKRPHTPIPASQDLDGAVNVQSKKGKEEEAVRYSIPPHVRAFINARMQDFNGMPHIPNTLIIALEAGFSEKVSV